MDGLARISQVKDGAEGAWLIAQQAIGEPDFQRRALKLLRGCGVEVGCLPGMRPASKTETRCMRAAHNAMARNGGMIPRTDAPVLDSG